MDESVSRNLVDPGRLSAVRDTGLLDTPADEAFDRLTRLAAQLLDCPYALVTLVDDRRSFWKSCIGVESVDPADRQIEVESSFCQYVVADEQPLFVNDTAADPRTSGNPSVTGRGVAAWAGFPLRSVNGQILGTFCVIDTVARSWTEQDVQVLQTLSAAAEVELALREAMAGAQLAAEAARLANEGLLMVAEVGHLLTSTLEIEQALARLAQVVVPGLSDWSIVSILDADGSLRDLASWHVDPAMRSTLERFAATRFTHRDEQGPMQQAVLSSQPIITLDVLARARQVLRHPDAIAAIEALAPQSSAVLPLMSNGRAVGVLSLCRGADRAPLSEAEIAVAAGIGQRAGLALETAGLYSQQRQITERLHTANRRLREVAQHDHTVARALQDALLTRLPEPEHLQLVARYLAADSSDQVGGDWYDAIILPDGATTLMIGDVIGHDIAAAAVMGQLRSMLRAFAWDHDEPPSATVSRLDRAMRDLHLNTLASVFAARIEQNPATAPTGARMLRWTSAGHPMPAIVYADGHAEILAGRNDVLLGIAPGSVRHDSTLIMPPGATLLLYTDGLVETRERDIEHGMQRLLQSLRANHHLPPGALLDAVLADLVGTQPADDVALLAVRFSAEDQARPPEARPAHP